MVPLTFPGRNCGSLEGHLRQRPDETQNGGTYGVLNSRVDRRAWVFWEPNRLCCWVSGGDHDDIFSLIKYLLTLIKIDYILFTTVY